MGVLIMAEDIIITAIFNIVIGIVSGIISAIIILVIVERNRRPNLEFEIESPPHKSPNGQTYLRLCVKNRKLNRLIALIFDGQPALMCHAWIRFQYVNGIDVYQQEMIGRWAGTPEPIHYEIGQDDSATAVVDFSQLRNWIDIPSGQSTTLDIVRQMSGDNYCHGWCNANYLRPPDQLEFKIDSGHYHVLIRVQTGGRDFHYTVKLINDMDFRLEKIN